MPTPPTLPTSPTPERAWEKAELVWNEAEVKIPEKAGLEQG